MQPVEHKAFRDDNKKTGQPLGDGRPAKKVSKKELYD
jgi:hypothetical protein